MSSVAQSCASPGCTKPLTSRLACPVCIKLSLTPAYFCGQDCFKANYASHNKIHKLARQIASAKGAASGHRKIPPNGITCASSESDAIRQSLPSWANAYNFSGSLRPTLISPKRTVPSSIRVPDYGNDTQGISMCEQRDRANNKSIRVYGSKELDGENGLRHACAMGREVLDVAGKALRPGVTTDEIDRIVHEASVERDCYPSPLNYYNFPKSVCTSVNEVICHGIPDYREVKDGDIVNIDVTTYNRGGYHGDLNETFCVGNIDDEGKMLVKTAFHCLQAALKLVKPGTLYRELGTAIHKCASASNCSVVRTYCGHGIGSLFHTAPNVPHYHKNKAKGIMKEGHVFTVEPMINLGVPGDITWGDNWTAVTTDGKRSAQFEHTLLVTRDGCEILTQRENEPVMCWNQDLISR